MQWVICSAVQCRAGQGRAGQGTGKGEAVQGRVRQCSVLVCMRRMNNEIKMQIKSSPKNRSKYENKITVCISALRYLELATVPHSQFTVR